MKVLGICGSPRRGGNTETLLDEALKGVAASGAEIEKIILSDLNISPCGEKEYEDVNEKGLSVINDDIQIIFKRIDQSDCLILASPIFFGSLSAQTKIMIDRFQCVWLAKNVLKKDIFNKGKLGALICAGGAPRNDFFENARSIVKHFFKIINVTYKEGLFCPGVEKKGDVLKHPDYLKKAFELGKKLAYSV